MLVCLLLTVLQSLYRTGSTWSTSGMSNETYQPLALRLPSSSNLCQAYLECARSTNRQVRVYFLLQVRTTCMYTASHHVIHLSRIGLDISVSVEGNIEQCLLGAWKQYLKRSVLRLEHKALDDHLVPPFSISWVGPENLVSCDSQP